MDKMELLEKLQENENCESYLDIVYEAILMYEIVSEESLELVTDINGYNIDTLNDVIYARTGYHDMEQFLEYEG